MTDFTDIIIDANNVVRDLFTLAGGNGLNMPSTQLLDELIPEGRKLLLTNDVLSELQLGRGNGGLADWLLGWLDDANNASRVSRVGVTLTAQDYIDEATSNPNGRIGGRVRTYTDYPIFLYKDMGPRIGGAVGDAVAHFMRHRGVEESYALLKDSVNFHENVNANGGVYTPNWGA